MIVFNPLKSEHVRSISTLQTTASFVIYGAMSSNGVEYARFGATNPLVPFSISYNMPIPFANIPFAANGSFNGVFALPAAQAYTNFGVPGAGTLPQYIRPFRTRGNPQ